MEFTSQDELKSHLMATNEEFRALAEEHSTLKRRVQELESQARLSDEETLEEQQLKKRKLHLKDQMTEILGRHQVQHA